MTTKKRIALITYHFPPDAAIGAVRQKEHAELLAQLGWEVHVVTVNPRYYEKLNTEKVLLHANIHLHRTAFCSAPLKMILRLKNRLFKKADAETKNYLSLPPPEKNPAFLQKLKQVIIDFNSFPDEQMMWVFPAVLSALPVVIKHKIPVVYVSSPPYTLNIIGVIMKMVTGAKLVIEHRDPWTTVDFLDKPFNRTKAALKLENSLERFILARADAVVTTTSIYRDFLEKQVGIPREDLICVYNGFDSKKFSPATIANSWSKDGGVNFSHFGNFYFGRNPSAFLKAICELIGEGILQPGKVSVDLVGLSPSDFIGDLCIGDLVKDLNLESIVTLIPWVDRAEAIRRMRESDVLLLFQPDSWKMQIPAKTFEYLPLRKPIFGLVGDGATADVIRECDAGIIVEQNDIPAIKQAIIQFVQNAPADSFYRNERVEAYSRLNQVAELDRFLTSLLPT